MSYSSELRYIRCVECKDISSECPSDCLLIMLRNEESNVSFLASLINSSTKEIEKRLQQIVDVAILLVNEIEIKSEHEADLIYAKERLGIILKVLAAKEAVSE